MYLWTPYINVSDYTQMSANNCKTCISLYIVCNVSQEESILDEAVLTPKIAMDNVHLYILLKYIINPNLRIVSTNDIRWYSVSKDGPYSIFYYSEKNTFEADLYLI